MRELSGPPVWMVCVPALRVGGLAAMPWFSCAALNGFTGCPAIARTKLVRGWCRRCNGTGLRVRVGRRVWTWVNREYREGQR